MSSPFPRRGGPRSPYVNAYLNRRHLEQAAKALETRSAGNAPSHPSHAALRAVRAALDRCEECHGSGKIELVRSMSYSERRYRECETCDGTGKR